MYTFYHIFNPVQLRVLWIQILLFCNCFCVGLTSSFRYASALKCLSVLLVCLSVCLSVCPALAAIALTAVLAEFIKSTSVSFLWFLGCTVVKYPVCDFFFKLLDTIVHQRTGLLVIFISNQQFWTNVFVSHRGLHSLRPSVPNHKSKTVKGQRLSSDGTSRSNIQPSRLDGSLCFVLMM